MKKKYLFLATLTGLLLVSPSAKAQSPMQWVQQRIGTGGHGHVFLGANVPFGYVQLGPTQRTRGWDWCSGYHDSDNVLIGFSHTHLSGTGIGDLGDVAFLPVANVTQDSVLYRHEQEEIRPGYYAVVLDNPKVKVELTATQRTGLHRYTFAEGEKPLVRLDLLQGIGWDKAYAVDFVQESATCISGLRFSHGWARDQKVYFVAEFSEPVKLISHADGVGVFQAQGTGKPLMIKVGLSAVSVEGARQNIKQEQPTWDFAQTVRNAQSSWNSELSRIKIEAKDASVRQIFYTAMYHAFGAPSVFNDVDHKYRGADGQTHEGNFTNYTTFSLWDTYRSMMPLLTLIHPTMAQNLGHTMLNISAQQGRLPVWHLMGNETDCMVGNPGVIAMGDLVLKNLVNDPEKAFQAMKQTMMQRERGLDLLAQYGYLPIDKDSTHETVAKTLEYAIADDAVARVAKMLGKKDDYAYFHQRSLAYRKLFDPSTHFMRGLDSQGNWRTPFNPFHAVHRMDDYTEGNAWQYTWLVPQNVPDLARLFGSERRFVSKLDSLFVVEGDLGADASPDISGLIGQYAHGNEPSHHILYMYYYVGQPWKSAPLLRRVMREMYTTAKDGLCGNEDVGQMSAWYILSSIGLYQVEPAGGVVLIGSPIVDKATIALKDGKSFEISVQNNSDQNIYVQRATLNGRPLTRSYLTYKELMQGGNLTLYMGSQPSKWGTAAKDRPKPNN